MAEDLEERVARFVADRGLFDPADALLLMVSGGADSMCLLHLVRRYSDGPVTVLTMDHGLRPEAADEVRTVTAACDALGVDVIARRLDLVAGPSLQARAREARYACARAVAAEGGHDHLVTGHTASDQAETVLFRLARGTGRDGAVGMRPGGAVVRPLLCATRDETRRWCAENGVAFHDDPSNGDRAYARTRVRHDLLEALRTVHPGAERAVARFAERLDDEAAVLGPLVDAAWSRVAGGTGLVCSRLLEEDPAIRRLLVRRLLSDATISSDACRVDQAIRLASAGRGWTDAPGGRFGVWRGELIADPAGVAPPGDVELSVPGEICFGDRMIRASRVMAELPRADRVDVVVGDQLTVRGVRPGDRIALAGGGHQAVGRLLGASGVPASRRPSVPVVASGGHVVWVSGYRAGVDVIAPPGTPATRLELL